MNERLVIAYIPVGPSSMNNMASVITSRFAKYSPFNFLASGHNNTVVWNIGGKCFWDIIIREIGGYGREVKRYRRKRFATFTDLANFVDNITDNGMVSLEAYFEMVDGIDMVTRVTGSNALYDSFLGRKKRPKYVFTLAAAQQLGLTKRQSSEYVQFADLLYDAAWGDIVSGSDLDKMRVIWVNDKVSNTKIGRLVGNSPIYPVGNQPAGLSGTNRGVYDGTSVIDVTNLMYKFDVEFGLVVMDDSLNLTRIKSGRPYKMYQRVMTYKSAVIAIPLRDSSGRRAVFLKHGFGIDHFALNRFDTTKYDVLLITRHEGLKNEYATIMSLSNGDDRWSDWIPLNKFFYKFGYSSRGFRASQNLMTTHVFKQTDIYLIAKSGGYVSKTSDWYIDESQHLGNVYRRIMHRGGGTNGILKIQ